MVIVDAVLNMDAVLHVVCCVETDSRVFHTDDQWPQSMTHSHPETSSLRSHTHTHTHKLCETLCLCSSGTSPDMAPLLPDSCSHPFLYQSTPSCVCVCV